jgi:tetratricopeptide (TPR) repeat protein
MTEVEEQKFGLELLKLIKKDAQAEAIPLLKGRKIHEIWCDKAVAVYASCGKKSQAREVIKWAKDNATDIASYRRCLLEYCGNLTRRRFKISGAKAICFGQATAEDREIFQEVIGKLSPIVDHVKANERVSNPLELEALLQTANAAIALGEADTLETCGSLLRKYELIPLEYVKLVLSHLVPAADPSNIAERLRSEHRGDFEAYLLALLVEADLCGNAKEAFEKGKKLKREASSEKEKRDLCGMLFQISQAIGVEAMQDVHGTSEQLLGARDTLTNVIAAAVQLRQGNIQAAKDILDKDRHEDDPQWLQMYSYCLFSEEKIGDGLTYFTKALEKVPSIEMYKTLGEVAAKGGFIDKAILAFETILDANPDDEVTRAKAAQLYLKASDYQGAEDHLRKLWETDRENVSYGMNYAACLANQGKIDDAIGTYRSLCRLEKPPIEAVVAVAQLYKTRHQPQEGFKFLEQYKEGFWDNPGFLMAYVDAGYASGHEVEAHEAFSRVLELQRKGKAPPDIVQAKTLDDLLRYHKQWTERTELICNNVLRGKLPWLMADNLLSHAAVMGWAVRTQPLTWLGDDAISRASYSIYSTNGFHAKEVDGKRRLEPLALPLKGSEVVIDLSALITLYRLDLLEEISKFFGKIYVSSRYASHLLAESGRLEFHQLSQVKSAKLIKQEIDSGNISVLADAGTPGNRPYPYVHEHTDDDVEHYYRLRDICKVLHEAGKIPGAKNAELLRIATEASAVDDEHPPLAYSQEITVELSTLRTLINFDVYDAVKDSFRLSITPEARKSLDVDLRTITYQEECQRWHDDLMKKLNQLETLAPNYSGEDIPDICMDSYCLGKSKGVSVLVDDRIIQALALNDGEFKGDIFGVDCLLKALERDGVLQVSECDSAYLKLIRWRYRFLVPSVDFLVRLAKQYKVSPPGNELMEVAGYVHDCMRDLGLFSGLEKTDPPIPMCGRFFAAWTDLVVRFVVHLWQDSDVTPETASAFTKWAFRELLPSPPRAFVPQRIDLVDGTVSLLFEKLLADLAVLPDTSRGKTAASSIREALYLSNEEFYRVFTETLDRIAGLYGED